MSAIREKMAVLAGSMVFMGVSMLIGVGLGKESKTCPAQKPPIVALCAAPETANGIPVGEFSPEPEKEKKPMKTEKLPAASEISLEPPDMETLRVGDAVYLSNGDRELVYGVRNLDAERWLIHTSTTTATYGRGGGGHEDYRIVAVERGK